MSMSRYSWTDEVDLTTAIGTTDEISFASTASGSVIIPTGSSITTLTWWGTDTLGGTYVPAQDKDGVAVTQTVAATKGYPIPIAMFGYRGIKAVSDAAGTVTVIGKG